MKTQAQWTEEVLDSLDGMTRASAPADLQQRIAARLAALPKRTIALVPRRTFWLMAAGLLLLVGTNLYVLKQAGGRSGDGRMVRKGSDNPIGAEYFAPTPSI